MHDVIIMMRLFAHLSRNPYGLWKECNAHKMLISSFFTSFWNSFHADKYLSSYIIVNINLRVKTQANFHAKHLLLLYHLSNNLNGWANFGRITEHNNSQLFVLGWAQVFVVN
jgi:hypothetical protein